MPAQNEVAEPAHQENTDDGGEAGAKQIDAIIMRRKQPRENEHADQSQHRREDIGSQIDAGLPDQHSAAAPANSLLGAIGASTVPLSAMAARMVATGVPEKDATEKATSCLSAPCSNCL